MMAKLSLMFWCSVLFIVACPLAGLCCLLSLGHYVPGFLLTLIQRATAGARDSLPQQHADAPVAPSPDCWPIPAQVMVVGSGPADAIVVDEETGKRVQPPEGAAWKLVIFQQPTKTQVGLIYDDVPVYRAQEAPATETVHGE